MSKSLRNTTASPVEINDTGISIAASATYVIVPVDYPLWAASVNVDSLITAGTLVVNDGYDDLKPQFGLLHIHEESMPRSSAYIATSVVQATAAVTTTLTASSRLFYTFTGTTAGQILKLPNATTLMVGYRIEVWNKSTQSIAIKDDATTTIFTLPTGCKTWIILQVNTTVAGTWLFQTAAIMPFNNATNGFVATNVQAAIEEIIGTPIGSVSTLVYTELGVATNEWLDYQANSVNSDQTHAILPYAAKLFAVTVANESISKETNLEIQKAAAGAGTTTTRVAVFQCRAFRTVRFGAFTPIQFNVGDKIGVYVDTTGLANPPSNLIVTLYFQVTGATSANTKENYSGNLPRQSTGGVIITHT